MAYRDLNPRTELEQAVAADLNAALGKRGAVIKHHGTSASHAPASAPCDISVVYGSGAGKRTVMVEVAQRNDATEFQSIVSHLDAWVAAHAGRVNLLYSGRATSARMARLVRNENERREDKGLRGYIVFLKFDDLEAFLAHWASLPDDESPLKGLDGVFSAWRECVDDLTSAEVFRRLLFPEWLQKKAEIDHEKEQRLSIQQERLKKDIVRLENQLRDRGITGQRAHKFLIYLFFMALYEDKRGIQTRATRQGFVEYRSGLPNAAKAKFKDATVHHLLSQDILADPDVKAAGIPSQYEKIDLPDEFVLSKVVKVFEDYSFADARIDAIGAVFEALARRAEKDNRIGQFFTPETAVAATCRLAGLRPHDLVADPACGTGRFLIQAMASMLSKASEFPGKSKDKAIQSIKFKQLLGCDLDPWVSIIAKMNMYIHGDGKSNIRHANGLTLSTIPAFAPQIVAPLVDKLDVVLTNPPLGDIDFRAVADRVARDEAAAAGSETSEASLATRAGEWSSEVFEVVPHRIKEVKEREIADRKASEYLERAVEHRLAGKLAAEQSARRKADEWAAKRATADMAIGSGQITHEAAGNTSKGGSLFISALIRSLKLVRDPALPLEWRGGILAMIIDEAVLNTPDYADARAFIRRHYFLKAIVSLPRDAFADLAKTTAKTSILLLIKKADPAVLQREPVVFARAFKTGAVSRDVTRTNDLVHICDAFDRWRSAVYNFCGASGGALPAVHIPAAITAMQAHTHPELQMAVRLLDKDNQTERLDEAYWCMKDLIGAMPNTVDLASVADLVANGRTPPERGVYSFASVSRVDVRVRPKGEAATHYAASDLRTVRAGDILVSGIDLVHGSVGVVDTDCDEMVVSKEYYILNAKPGVDAHYLVSLLRTPAMRRIVEGTVTGTSNRTRVESADVLMSIRIPPLPDAVRQAEIGDQLREAHVHHRRMLAGIQGAETGAATVSGLAVIADQNEAIDSVSSAG